MFSRRLGDADDHARVLLREEAFGNDDVEIAGEADRPQHRQEGDELVPQHDLETTLVKAEQAVEAALRAAGRDIRAAPCSRA